MAMAHGMGASDYELEAVVRLAVTRLVLRPRGARLAGRRTLTLGAPARDAAAALTSAPPRRRGRACIPLAEASTPTRSSEPADGSALTSGSPRGRLRA